MKKIDLCGAWEGRCILPDQCAFDFVGNVPGCAIHDLVQAGRLPTDLFWRDHADAVSSFEACDYVYQKQFDLTTPFAQAILRFERIDTYADIFLNGEKLAHCENGNIRHDFDVSSLLVEGRNTLEIYLFSPSEWVKDIPERQGAFSTDRMNTRRMQCTYGWDWVARFLTCGIGECTLLTLEQDELFTEDVYITTTDADEQSATVRVDIGFDTPYRGRILEFLILDPEGAMVCRTEKYYAEPHIRLDFDVPSPRLWYPIGYGAQPLYTFLLKDGEQTICREVFGIRTVKIMQLPDAPDSRNHAVCLSIKNERYDFNESFSGFVVKINGDPIFCRGANWVPCEPYCTGNIDARQTEILELCAEAGVNMLRVWGGGAFESRHFYNECSRLGITVTQDFLMACGDYPEEQDWFIEELKKEAFYAARLLRNQPCLLWWTGDNENAVKGCDTDENYRGRRSAYEGIAPILYREDPARRFLPSSPFGGKLYASNTVGTTHNTQYLSKTFQYLLGDDLSDYKDEFKKYRARFIAEEPQGGAASSSSLCRFMTTEDILEGEEMWLHHTKTNPALPYELFEYFRMMTEKIFGSFEDGYDRLFKLRYLQFEWIRVVMEQARRERELCSGILFWMMNDCWPAAAGWSLIDYYNLPKDGFYSFKRCAKPTIASIDREDGMYRVYLIHDGAAGAIKGTVRVLSADRKTIKDSHEFWCLAEKASVTVAFEREEPLSDGEILLCDIEGEFGHDRAFYRNGALPLSPTLANIEIDEETNTLTITADEYVHALTLSGNAIFEDNCFSLLPGESRTISFRPLKEDLPVVLSFEAYTIA